MLYAQKNRFLNEIPKLVLSLSTGVEIVDFY